MKMLALGPNGTNGHEAAKKASSSAIGLFVRRTISFLPSQNEILCKVAKQNGVEGVVAIENSIVGHVPEVLSFWINNPLRDRVRVVGEVFLPIHHQFLVHPSVMDIKEITSVISHSHALAQTQKSLDKFPWITERVEISSTGFAAQDVASGKLLSRAAIASPFAREEHGLKALIEKIEDMPNNETRFHIVGTTTPDPTGHDRTALLCVVKNTPFSLRNVLNSISVNTSSIKIPIPVASKDRCGLYLEFDEHAHTSKGKKIMKELNKAVESVFVLGSFPRERGR